ncbi:MAG: carboxypeptidase regulatory-like domain-containing protein, partial [Isosphaeraceae bacterium]
MTNAKLKMMAATALSAMLLTAGAGLMACAATGQANTPQKNRPGQEGRQAVAVTQPAQRPSPPAASTTTPAAEKGPVVIEAEVFDQEGRRLPGADVLVVVQYSRGADDQQSIVERMTTDGEGRVRLEVARERPGARLFSTYVWAHQPGRALATSAVFLGGNSPPAPIRLTLDQPARQTITILGSDDRPIGGLRVAPISVRPTNRRSSPTTVPDEWVDRLTVTTNAKGAATLEYLPAILAPVSIRVSGPEVAPHALPLDAPQEKDSRIKLGRRGRLVGFVRTLAGEPLADFPVEVWAQGGRIVHGPILDRRATADEIVRLEPALKTGPEGSFQTPPTMLGGSSYRVSIRHPGFVPYFSDWVRLDGERATIPPIRLQALLRLSGRIQDRQGRAVTGARVFVPGGGPSTTTDANGGFALAGVNPGKNVVLFEHAGFWLDGRLVDPSAGVELGPLTLVRKNEQPGPIIKPQADPIAPEEARALADRLLEPYLRAGPQQRDDRARLAAIASLGEFDLDRALDLLQDGKFPFRTSDSSA